MEEVGWRGLATVERGDKLGGVHRIRDRDSGVGGQPEKL
jgi:hypothetical protein